MGPQAAEFTPYGASHLGAVLVLAVGIVALLALGRLEDPGITLTSQAVLPPTDLSADFPDRIFVLFWTVIIATVWALMTWPWVRGDQVRSRVPGERPDAAGRSGG